MNHFSILDGHNDTLTQIHNARGESVRSFLVRSDWGHIDLPRAIEGGLAGGFYAIFTASPNYSGDRQPLIGDDGAVVPGGYAHPLPTKLPRRSATTYVLEIISDLYRMVEASEGQVEVVRNAADLARCVGTGKHAVILHIEGAEAIDSDLKTLDVLYHAGLRSIGPVWSRPTIFGHGVPFDYPRSPDTGPGLTNAGKRLVTRCNELGIMLDLSHLNEKGFWDVARLSDAPLVATHSAAHALCPVPRNLTDAQIDAVAASGGIIGVNFHVGFLREDGNGSGKSFTPLTEIVRHARYIADRIGVEHVALGSDFDGATMPTDLGDVTGLPRLMDALSASGFSEVDLTRIAYTNWVRVLEKTWHG
jgi:membrane dipeptidase